MSSPVALDSGSASELPSWRDHEEISTGVNSLGAPTAATTQTLQHRQPQVVGARKRELTPVPRVRQQVAKPTSPAWHDAEWRGPMQPASISKLPAGRLVTAAFSEGALRAGFRRKVYGILAAQMVVTLGVCLACMRVASIRLALVKVALSGSWMLRAAIFLPTLLSLGMLQAGAKRHYPANYILLLIFTLAQSVNVGFICAMYESAGLGEIVTTAFAITAGLFLMLTAYVLVSGKDFSHLRGFLLSMLIGLVAVGFVGLFFPSMVDSLVISMLGALTFCGYILFDTWRIEKEYGYDDYIPAAIELYLDIINLFLYILKILVKLSSKEKK